MLEMRRLDSAAPEFAARLSALTELGATLDSGVEAVVREILADVKDRGDPAVLEYTRRFDAIPESRLSALEVSPEELAAAHRALDSEARAALEMAAERVDSYHRRQMVASWSYTEADGTRLGQRITPLDRVGIYVPGGKAAYPSSVLMNAIPARVAGVAKTIMVVPTPGGERNTMVLAAAHVAGISRVFTIGGAQAIAALAYGTQTIPQVDKIVGPGNAYVAAAKRQVFGVVGIDMIAGPSEILIIADASANPEWVAIDLLSQAEHDEVAQAILLTPEPSLIDAVASHIERLLQELPRAKVITASLANRGALIRVRDLAEACEISNRIAPEHLELAVSEPQDCLPMLTHAGAIFVGHWSSEALGDYCAGPSHVLPTARSARFSSPLGVYDFQKRSSIMEVSPEGARTLGRVAMTLAQEEGLSAHARSAACRVNA